jgi:hypothetical protein
MILVMTNEAKIAGQREFFFYEIIFCLLKKEILDYKNKIGVTD